MSRYEPLAAFLEDARVVVRQTGLTDEVWLPSRDELVRVKVTDINRVVAERDYVRIFVEARSFLLRATMARIAEELGDDRFVRIHRSILVAKADVTALRHTGGGAWAVIHRDGIESPIGRSYHAAVRRALGAPPMTRTIVGERAKRTPPVSR